jgi:hypothetical protein
MRRFVVNCWRWNVTDTRIDELLDKLTPSYDDRRGDWEGVAAAAAQQTNRRRVAFSTRVRLGVLVAAIAAAAGVMLAWPFDNQQGNLLDRALAAVGEGPVLHVVLRGEWGGTLVDLNHGDRKPVYGDTEVWYDSASGRAHTIGRLGGVIQDEEVGEPKKPAAAFVAPGREYRQALESGTARITGADTIDGESVVWVTIHSELLPDVADNMNHEWAQEVAVSKRTFKPVALRETRDGQPGPGTQQRVLELELLAGGEGDFTASRPTRNGTAFKQAREAISLAQASDVLGRPGLWLGRQYDGLQLARVYRETTSVGRQQRIRVTRQQRVRVIPATDGPIQWRDDQRSVVLYYGTVGDDPSTSREDSIPLFDKPYLTVTQATNVSPFRRGVGTYVPPEGSVFIVAGGRTGFLQRNGIHIGIDAGSERAVLAVARALRPMER